MVGVAERTTEQRKLQTVAGREIPTKDKKRDGEMISFYSKTIAASMCQTHERMDG